MAKKIKETNKLFKTLERHGCTVTNSSKGNKIFPPKTFTMPMINEDGKEVMWERSILESKFYTMHASDRGGIKPFMDHIVKKWDISFVMHIAPDLETWYPNFVKKVAKKFSESGGND